MAVTTTPFPTARVLDRDDRIAAIAYTVPHEGTYRVTVPAHLAGVAVRELPAAAMSLRHVRMLREMLQVADRFEHGDGPETDRLRRNIAEYLADATDRAERSGIALEDVL